MHWNSNIFKFRNLLKSKENELIKAIAQNFNITTKQDIKIIIDHYQNLAILDIKKSEYLKFLVTFITLLPIILKDIFGINIGIELSYKYIIGFLIIFTIMYFSYKQTASLLKILKGEENLYSNLESCFTEYYLMFQD